MEVESVEPIAADRIPVAADRAPIYAPGGGRQAVTLLSPIAGVVHAFPLDWLQEHLAGFVRELGESHLELSMFYAAHRSLRASQFDRG